MARTRRVTTAWLALMIYVGAAVVAPLVHAEGEVLWTQASYEAHHTSGCAVIHSDAGCPTIGQFTSPELAARRLTSFQGTEHRLVVPAVDRPVGALLVTVHRTRAPPS